MSGASEFGRNGDGVDFARDRGVQLSLDDEDERLPWLESGDDEDDGQSADSGRFLGMAFIALIALLVIIGLIWWLSNRGANPDTVADGGTIAAPEAPYKAKPDNPGGREFAGTGDTSFRVGEGETTDGKLASTEPPKPSIDTAQGAAAGKPAAPAADDTTGPTGGIGVQVGAYNSKEAAQAGWNTLYTANEALHGYKYRIVQGKADIGNVYRLQAVAGDAAAAESLCARLKAAGTACQVKR